jgi:hypothetical protein
MGIENKYMDKEMRLAKKTNEQRQKVKIKKGEEYTAFQVQDKLHLNCTVAILYILI